MALWDDKGRLGTNVHSHGGQLRKDGGRRELSGSDTSQRSKTGKHYWFYNRIRINNSSERWRLRQTASRRGICISGEWNYGFCYPKSLHFLVCISMVHLAVFLSLHHKSQFYRWNSVHVSKRFYTENNCWKGLLTSTFKFKIKSYVDRLRLNI